MRLRNTFRYVSPIYLEEFFLYDTRSGTAFATQQLESCLGLELRTSSSETFEFVKWNPPCVFLGLLQVSCNSEIQSKLPVHTQSYLNIERNSVSGSFIAMAFLQRTDIFRNACFLTFMVALYLR